MVSTKKIENIWAIEGEGIEIQKRRARSIEVDKDR